MNYQLHYDRLIEKHGSWLKPKGIYTERHRKLPGYLGGKYVKGNAFYIPIRAHYVAHLLWAKITNHPEAWLPITLFRKAISKGSSKLYEIAKVRSISTLREVLNSVRKKAGDNAVVNKTGVHAATKAQRVEWARNAGKTTRDYKQGVHAATSLQLSEWGSRASDVKYKCLECGMVSTCGALGKHQKASNHIGKIRLS